jgi:glycosyltransferase involved in cell wall biosynthesis
MQKIKILEIIESYNIGGAETMLLTLLEGLDRDVFSLELCSIGHGPLINEAKKRACLVTEIAPFQGKKDMRFLLKLMQIVRRAEPDVIHSHLLFTHFYACLAGSVLRIPVIVTFHSNDELETVAERIMVRMIYHLSKKVVIVTKYQFKHFGFSENSSKITVIPNGTKFTEISPMDIQKFRNLKRRELGFDTKEKLIAYVGNFRPVKGHAYILQAMKTIVRNHPSAHLLLIGDGRLNNDLMNKCREYNIEDRVHFLGFRKDIKALLSAVDIAVSSSLSETNSIAIMEAMAVGRPVVATDVGGNYELVIDGETGILVPPKSHHALANSISMLLDDSDLVSKLGRNAKEKIRRDFTAAKMIRRYVGKFHEIARR